MCKCFDINTYQQNYDKNCGELEILESLSKHSS